ncbi:tetratricopeptide repeat protein [Melittangium boletus]|uniref:tetratricopeptide repeat protein n=1 Tax=Melittangium boletus TaxID=83453 RepID=UPI003DA34ABB
MGVGFQRRDRGDFPGALEAFAEALAAVEGPRVNDNPLASASASSAMMSYAEMAEKLGRRQELLELLLRWRPTYLEWLKSPPTEDVARFIQWCEQLLGHAAPAHLSDPNVVRAWLEQDLEVSRGSRVLGETHAHTLERVRALFHCLMEQNDHEAARALLERTLAACRKKRGAEDPEVIWLQQQREGLTPPTR